MTYSSCLLSAAHAVATQRGLAPAYPSRWVAEGGYLCWAPITEQDGVMLTTVHVRDQHRVLSQVQQ